jgi:signal peptidase I
MKHRAEKGPAAKTVVPAVLSALLLLAVLSAGVFYLMGGRYSVIKTPSMADYAPVGSFVVSKPVDYASIQKGDTILFVPPGSESTYFHRVTDVTPAGLQTKGDLNGSVDPWTLTQDNILGKEAFHVHNLGFLLTLGPFFLIGGVAIHMFTKFKFSKYNRFPARVTGWTFLTAIAVFISKPLFKAELISQTVEKGEATTNYVTTGIFGVKATAERGTTDHAFPGEIGTVVSSWHDKAGYFNVELSPYLGVTEWIVLLGVILAPLALCMLFSAWSSYKGYDQLIQAKGRHTA